MSEGDSNLIGAVVLAAGSSSRLGHPKQTLKFQNESLLRRTARTALEAGCAPVVVVTGANAHLSRAELRGLNVHEAANPDWESGMASSIRVGIGSLLEAEPRISAVVLLVCDQPFLSAELIEELISVHIAERKPIAASGYADSFGVPALFRRALFPELLELSGAAGAKQLIKAYVSETEIVPFPNGEVDIDTPHDYAELAGEFE